MPVLPKQILNCVIYFYPSVEAAQQGKKFGGTGFLVGKPLSIGDINDLSSIEFEIFAVTNRHVALNGSNVIRLNNKDGSQDIITKNSSEWLSDIDDVAICRIDELDEQKHDHRNGR